MVELVFGLVSVLCEGGKLLLKLTALSVITEVLLLTERQVPPLSVRVKRVSPTPASTTKRPPLLSNLMPRGLLRPVATSWAFHPLAATGGEYDGVRTVAQAVDDDDERAVVVVVAGVVCCASARLAPSSRAAVTAVLRRELMLIERMEHQSMETSV